MCWLRNLKEIETGQRRPSREEAQAQHNCHRPDRNAAHRRPSQGEIIHSNKMLPAERGGIKTNLPGRKENCEKPAGRFSRAADGESIKGSGACLRFTCPVTGNMGS